MIYLIICLFIVLLAYLEAIKLSKVSSAIYGVIVCLILVFLAGLRDKVGTDWNAYYDFYLYGNDTVEPGYMFVNNLFSKLGLPYYMFLFFLNSISLALFYKSLKHYAVFFVVSLLLFYCELFLYLNLSGIRQAIALSILIYSIRFSINRNFIAFLACVIVAFSFHVTSVVFIFAYFVPFRKFNKKEFILITGLFALLSSIIFFIANYLDGDLAYKAKFYLDWQENDPNIKMNYIIGGIKRSIILVLILMYGKKLLETTNGIYFFNLYLIGYGVFWSTYLISPDIGTRLAGYFLIFEIFLAGNLILVNKKLTTRLIIVSVIATQAIYKITLYMGFETYIYHSIF